MNRRQFFGMSAAAVALAGLPSLVLPERTIFLPPSAGWFSTPLTMRETRQYAINIDAMLLRYDAAWLKDGKRHQYHVDMVLTPELAANSHKSLDHAKEVARSTLERFMNENGLVRAHRIELPVPRHVDSRYV